MINEYSGIMLCYSNNSNICPITGEDYLTSFKIEHANDWDLWKNFFAVGCIAIGFLVLAYIQLFRMKKTK